MGDSKADEDRGPGGVEAYLAALPEVQRAALEDLRATIRAAAPDAEECISYGMPAFRQKGMLVYYAAFKNHCSFFPGNSKLIPLFAEDLAGFETDKGTIRFTPEHPLPKAFVTKIVLMRVAENEAKKKGR